MGSVVVEPVQEEKTEGEKLRARVISGGPTQMRRRARGRAEEQSTGGEGGKRGRLGSGALAGRAAGGAKKAANTGGVVVYPGVRKRRSGKGW